MKKFYLVSIIAVVLLVIGLIVGEIIGQTIIHYTAKVPKNYDAVLGDTQREIIYEENGIKFHYDCNSMTGKSIISGLKPHRGAGFYITFETDETISNIRIEKCKFENKQLRAPLKTIF